jgi:organic hydroperoxide reductase OsmC/OhrA
VSSRGRTFAYTASLARESGRRARVTAGEREPIATAPPGDFPGGDERRWSPEHLYLAALESCTMLSFLAHAEHHGVPVREYSAEIEGTIQRREPDGRYAFVSVLHRPTVTVARGHRDAARSLCERAERDCFVSASTNAEIVVRWEIREE